MIDKYGREIDYLRISLTDRCNLRCIYCMPEEGVKSLSHAEILTYDEILRICRCAADLGIRKIKLTGGEPLVRKGCASLAKQIKAIPGIEKVTLTTNGILLAKQLDALLDAGIDAINISLDTLNPELFKKVARRDGLEKVFEGIEAALAHPGLSLKINSVPVIKEKENFIGIAGLAQKYPIHVRFIEMMPIGFGKQFPFQDEESIKAVLEEAYGPMHAVNERYGNGPCHYYEIAGFKGKIGFISAMTHKFCSQCNRVRLTSEGFMKGCLQYQKGTDLRGLMRGGCMDSELKKAIYQVIWNKPVSHNFYEAKTEQGKLYSKIAELKVLIENAEIVDNMDENTPKDAITLGSIVKVRDIEEDFEETYEIVGSQEANPREGRISDDSPLGRGLHGHKAGETVVVNAPAGDIKFEILSVENN